MSNRIDNLSQDVTNANNRSFSAPCAVAGHAEPTPDKVPHCLYADGRGLTLGGPAAVLAPSGADSLTHVSFESLIDRVRELEFHFGYLPDRYLQSLRGQIISSRDQSVIMSGDSIIDSVRSHRLRVCDPVSPTPGSSRDGDSIVPFLQSLFGSSTFISSSRPVPSAALPSVSGATFMDGCGAVGGGGPKVGLSDPLCVGSYSLCSSHSSAELFSFVHQGESSPGGDRGVDRQRGCRTSPVVSRFLQSPVRGPEDFRVMEACDRPVVIGRVRPTHSV